MKKYVFINPYVKQPAIEEKQKAVEPKETKQPIKEVRKPEKYVYKNPYVQIYSREEEIINRNEKAEATPKAKVVKYIPAALKEALEELSLSKIMMNKAKKLTCLIFQRSLQDHEDASEFISLPAKYLEKLFGSYYHADFFNLLKKTNIIETNEDYMQGSKAFPGYSKSYRIGLHLLEGDFKQVTYEDKYEETQIIKLIVEYEAKKPQYGGNAENYFIAPLSSSDPLISSSTSLLSSSDTSSSTSSNTMLISYELYANELLFADLSSLEYSERSLTKISVQETLNISYEVFKIDDQVEEESFRVINHINTRMYYTNKQSALAYCKEHKAFLIQDKNQYHIANLEEYIFRKKRNIILNYKWQIARLVNKDFFAKRNDTNRRLDHNLTSLPKRLLQVIKKENNLVEIDLCNSQFAIHAYWLKQESYCERYEDARRYYDMCSKGILYETLAEQLGMSRSEAKQTMIGLAFASNRYSNANKVKFKNQFPTVLSQIDGFKKESKKSSFFSVELQEMEAELFVDSLYPLIKKDGLFCVTKHDSLIIRSCDADKILTIVRLFFNEIKFECVLDMEGEKITIQNDHDIQYEIWRNK